MMSMKQQDKVCLILGVSSGIGRACALALSRESYDVLGLYFDIAEREPLADELRRELGQHSGRVHLFNRNADSKRTREETVADIGKILESRPIDVLLHSLAFGTLLPFIRTSPEVDVIQKSQMDMTMSVMAHSLVYWTQDLWAEKLIARGSRIFAMTSGGSVMYTKNYGAVSAAKCALESHTKQLALELAPHGVMVNCLRAGVTDTPSLRKIPEADALLQRARVNNPHGRLSTPEDVAASVVALSHLQSTWMTGNVINVDGGEILTI
jgi:NAD(P)-dependent dehydrogenase (short-subunit alcohol dehydrogenase family)